MGKRYDTTDKTSPLPFAMLQQPDPWHPLSAEERQAYARGQALDVQNSAWNRMRAMSPTYGNGGAPTPDAGMAARYFQAANRLSYTPSGGVPGAGAGAGAGAGTGAGAPTFNSGGGIPGVTAPTLRSADVLAKLYGVNIDQAAIQKTYQDAVNSAYRAANRDYTRNLGDTQMAYLDTMRKSNAAAMQSGAAKGMQGAQELSAMLGLSQQSVGGASKLADDQATAYQKAVQDAMAYADQNKLALGQLSTDLYGTDVTREGNQMSIAQQYREMLSREGMANADRKMTADANAAAGTDDDPEIRRWRLLFNKKPGEPFTPYEIALVKGVAPSDMPGYGLNPPGGATGDPTDPTKAGTFASDIRNGFVGQAASLNPIFQAYNWLYGQASGGKSFLPKKYW